MGRLRIGRARREHRLFVERLSVRNFEDRRAVSGGRLFDNVELPCFVAWIGGRPTGFLTYMKKGRTCLLVSIASRVKRRGVGTALLRTLFSQARRLGCRRVRVFTTNDNLPALLFYQRRGFHITEVRRNAIRRARRLLKPTIPRKGYRGIPIDHEIMLEIDLKDRKE